MFVSICGLYKSLFSCLLYDLITCNNQTWNLCFTIYCGTFLLWYILYEAIFKYGYTFSLFQPPDILQSSECVAIAHPQTTVTKTGKWVRVQTWVLRQSVIYNFCKSSAFCKPQKCKYGILICIFFWKPLCRPTLLSHISDIWCVCYSSML